jgi:hypothetical protein
MGGVTPDSVQDRHHNTFCFHQYFMVPESKHPESPFGKPCIAIRIAGRFQMLATIDFHDQLTFQADEVDDIGPDRVLTSKTETFQLSHPQMTPESLLGVRHRRTQATGQCFFGVFTQGLAPILPFPRKRGKEFSDWRCRT